MEISKWKWYHHVILAICCMGLGALLNIIFF
jgi:hypothetical protein